MFIIRNKRVLKYIVFLCISAILTSKIMAFAQESEGAGIEDQNIISQENIELDQDEELHQIEPDERGDIEDSTEPNESQVDDVEPDEGEDDYIEPDEIKEGGIESDETKKSLEGDIEEDELAEGSLTWEADSKEDAVVEPYIEIVKEPEVEGKIIEETSSQRYVKGLYKILLEREADENGLKYYVDALDRKSGTACSTVWAIVNSPEFNRKNYENRIYVSKLYSALLGREAGEAEVTKWVNQIEEGVSRRYILRQIVSSSEFIKVCNNYGIIKGSIQILENRDKNYDVTAYVSRCYKTILGRGADVSGLNFWTGEMLSGKSGAEIIKNFVCSPEFSLKKKSNSEFMDIMYQAMLGRSADMSGKAYWLDCLEKGVSYRYIIKGFTVSKEFNKICSEYGISAGKIEITEGRDKNIGVTSFVSRNYQLALGRKPDIIGLNYWCNQIIGNSKTPAQVAYGFIFSNELAKKKLNNTDFIRLLYETCLGRAADSSGQQYWIARLNAGATRQSVFWSFANSLEFKKMITAFGLSGGAYETIEITYCELSPQMSSKSGISIHAKRNSIMEKLVSSLYIVRLNSKGDKIIASSRASSSVGNDWILNADFENPDSFRTAVMEKYGIAIKIGESLQLISNSMYLSNPEIIAVTTKTYPGFYEGQLTSKKGMQGVHAYATEELGIQASLLNIKLNELIRTSANVAKYGSACYIPYVYNKKTYYFYDMISYMKTVKGLNGWTGEYGSVHRNVTLNLLLGWDDELKNLVHPSARIAGKNYYTLNMTEENARETFEALFCYLAEKLGGSVLLSTESSPYKYRVANWVLGNEVNACQMWNYSGNMSLKECADNYAEAFQLLYQGVKRTDSEARVFISLDHDWNAGENGHSGKAFLDEFALFMNMTAPHMRWNVNYHPYSQPLTRNDFWNDSVNTVFSVNTGFISMYNLEVLTNYLGELERRYFPQKGNEYIRVILGEQGFIASDKGQEAFQAAAIGYGFYIASMNTRIDAYIIRAYKDDPAEGVMKQGLMYQNEIHKESYNMYAALGTEKSITCMNSYLHLVNENAVDWTQIIPGLKLSLLYH